MENETTKVDIAIAGAGMVGATVANLFARCGFSVALIEAHQPKEFVPEADVGLRVSAISPGSAAVLEQAGAWAEIENQRSCAYRRMHVEEQSNVGGEPEGLDFEAPVFGMERLGTIVENQLIQTVLWKIAVDSPVIQIFCPAKLKDIEHQDHAVRLALSSGETIEACILIGADGAVSAVRRKAGIKQDIWDYNQKAVVSVVRKTEDNPGTAWQRFLPDGPLAFLPLSDGRSSIVWTLPCREAERMLSLDEDGFRAELNSASEGWLGETIECGPRAAFPLLMRLSDRYLADRLILLGDAAHVVHPLAGQGVNLGLADAAALVETLLESRKAGRDIADQKSLRKFELWRKSESEIMAAGIHGLRALFMPAGLSNARRAGLKLVSKSWALKEIFLQRAAGQGRNAPRISKGDSLQSLMQSS